MRRQSIDEQAVIEMNEICLNVSGWVQCTSSRVASEIEGTGDSADISEIPEERRTTMFKTISAALLAVSVLAAPAFAATGKTAQTPVIKATQTKTTQIKATPTKAGALNANAKMGKHHTRYVRHHHHKKMAAHRSHAKVSYKHTSHTYTKRG
jgi:hypothetical protein